MGDKNKNQANLKPTLDLDENIEWDNGEVTYGHMITNSSFKRKDLPDPQHQQHLEETSNKKIRKSLKNSKFIKDEDIANRNKGAEKGIGGQNL